MISAAGMNLRRSMTVPLQYMPLKFRANQQRKRYRSKSIANQTTKAQKKLPEELHGAAQRGGSEVSVSGDHKRNKGPKSCNGFLRQRSDKAQNNTLGGTIPLLPRRSLMGPLLAYSTGKKQEQHEKAFIEKQN